MRPVIIYTTTDETVPAHLRCIAKFKDGAKLLPLVITGPTEDAVRAEAVRWWTDEVARQQKAGTIRKPGTVISTPDPLAGLLPPVPVPAGLLPR